MSSTVSSSDGGNAQGKEESSEREDEQTLRIKTSAEADNDLDLIFVPLFGAPPNESSVWQSATRRKKDGRSLSAYTVRYECAESTLRVNDYEAVRQGIWRQVKQLLDDDQLSHLISIAFDQGLLDDDGDRPGLIDLMFDSADALAQVACGLHYIKVKESHDVQHSYSRTAFTTSLPGSILPIDCQNLPVDDLDAEELFKALEAALQPAGSLLGFGKLAIMSKTWKVRSQGTGTTRFYLRLHQDNMSIPWLDFVHLLPTMLKINGVVHNLYYCGRHLHTEDVLSPNLTVARIDDAEAEGSATKKHRAAPSDESSSTASKRRRSNK